MNKNSIDVEITPEEYTVLERILPRFIDSVNYYNHKKERILNRLVDIGTISDKTKLDKTTFNTILIDMISNIQAQTQHQRLSPAMTHMDLIIPSFCPLGDMETDPSTNTLAMSQASLTHLVIHCSEVAKIFSMLFTGSDKKLFDSIEAKFKALLNNEQTLEQAFAAIEDPSEIFDLLSNETLNFYRLYKKYLKQLRAVISVVELKSFTQKELDEAKEQISSGIDNKRDKDDYYAKLRDSVDQYNIIAAKVLLPKYVFETLNILSYLGAITLIGLVITQPIALSFKLAAIILSATLPTIYTMWFGIDYYNDHLMRSKGSEPSPMNESIVENNQNQASSIKLFSKVHSAQTSTKVSDFSPTKEDEPSFMTRLNH